MRTRQPWDKTGTKQIHCLKLTSKHFAFEVKLIEVWSPFHQRRLHLPVCGHSEEDCSKRGSLKIFRCVKVGQINFLLTFTFSNMFQSIKWCGQWRGWLHCRKPPEHPVGGQSPLWLQVINFCVSGIFLFLMPSILRSNNWEWQNYPKTRFASEYGFQAFSAFSVLEPVITTFFCQKMKSKCH